MPYLQRYSPTKLCDGAQMAIFGDFFASCICSEPRAAGFRPLRLGEEKKEEEEEEERRKKQDENIMVCPIT